MASIKQKNTGIEKTVFNGLRKEGLSFQRNYKKVLGSPDVALPRQKVAIFIDGAFWHGYRYPSWSKRLSSKFWKTKIERNRKRDRNTFAKLRGDGWRVMRVWEHELEADSEKAIKKIVSLVKSA